MGRNSIAEERLKIRCSRVYKEQEGREFSHNRMRPHRSVYRIYTFIAIRPSRNTPPLSERLYSLYSNGIRTDFNVTRVLHTRACVARAAFTTCNDTRP